ncbi:general substrate transporter [Aspergillus heterothallicus]
MASNPYYENASGMEPAQDTLADDITAVKRDAVTLANAKRATENEHNMSALNCVKLYPKAIAWSIVISTCIVMEAYDVSLLSNFYAFAQFNEKYGRQLPDGSYQVSAPWQAALSNGVNVGEIIGLLLNGLISERIGYRYTVMIFLTVLIGFIAIFFTAPNVKVLLGVFQTLTVSYAAEVCPVALRGYLTTYVNFCWGLGHTVALGVIRGMLHRHDEWAYRIPYALQWMWPVPLLTAIAFAPDSPWWLVRKGRLEDAKKALLRLTRQDQRARTGFDADETVSMTVHTNALENSITQIATYLDCFKGTDRRRTEIVCIVWAIQNLKQAGLDADNSYKFAIGQYSINMAGVLGAWFLMSLGVGRRTLYLFGLCGLFTMLLIMGFLGLMPDTHQREASLATGSFMLGWAACYQLSVGTVCYSLVAELPTRRLQIKTVVLGRALFITVNIVCSVLTLYMLNPTAWNWSNFAGFFWAASCGLCIVYVFFRVPQPTERTFAELDILFERRVSARKFASTEVDVFGSDDEAHQVEHDNGEKAGTVHAEVAEA